MDKHETIVHLENLLQNQFGSAQAFASQSEKFTTGVACLDRLDIRCGNLVEVTSQSLSSGIGLMTGRLLDSEEICGPIALIDGRDSFDPESFSPFQLSRTLWVRCRNAADSLKAADWLLRDGNLRFILLDLQLNPSREIREIPASSWYRLKSLARETEATLLAFTPEKVIPCANPVVLLERDYSASSFDQRREDIPLWIKPERVRATPYQNRAGELVSKAG